MTAISKNVYFDVLDDIANRYNNTVHKTIKTKPIEVTDDSYAEYNEGFFKKDPKFNKLPPVPVDLSKLSSDVVKNDVKKTVYDKLVAKVDNIDTSVFVLKTKYNIDKTELENKISDVSNLVKKTKLTELENKIPDISNLATKTAVTTVENKIPNVSNLVNIIKESSIYYVQLICLVKDKKQTSIVNVFKKIILNCKPNKIWVDQGSEFYNNPFKDLLKLKINLIIIIMTNILILQSLIN